MEPVTRTATSDASDDEANEAEMVMPDRRSQLGGVIVMEQSTAAASSNSVAEAVQLPPAPGSSRSSATDGLCPQQTSVPAAAGTAATAVAMEDDQQEHESGLGGGGTKCSADAGDAAALRLAGDVAGAVAAGYSAKPGRVCSVCGDRAQGFNFNAVTCQSCKAFFRRTASKTTAVQCAMTGECHLDINTRRFCPACRLHKCYSVGMKRELILGEEEKAHRKEKVRRNREQKQRALQEAAVTAMMPGALVPGTISEAFSRQGRLSASSCEEDNQKPSVATSVDVEELLIMPSSKGSGHGKGRAPEVAGVISEEGSATAQPPAAGLVLDLPAFLGYVQPRHSSHRALAGPLVSEVDVACRTSDVPGTNLGPVNSASAADVDDDGVTVTAFAVVDQDAMAGKQLGAGKDNFKREGTLTAAAVPTTATWQSIAGSSSSGRGSAFDTAAVPASHHSNATSVHGHSSRRSVCVVLPFTSSSAAANTIRSGLPSPLVQPNLRRGLTDGQLAELSMLKIGYTQMFSLASGDGGAATTEMFRHSGRNFFAKRARFVLRGLLGFGMQLQGFSAVSRKVQASLLKSAAMNCMLLRSVQLFDLDSDRWDDGHGTIFRLLDLSQTFEGVEVDLRQLALLARTFKQQLPTPACSGHARRVDDMTLFALLQCIMLLSPEHATDDDSRDAVADVSDAQQHYLSLLRNHLESAYSFACAADLLPVLMQRLNTYKCLAQQARRLLSSLAPLEPMLQGVI